MNISALYADFSFRQMAIQQSAEINVLVEGALRHVIHETFGQIASSFVITIAAFSGKANYWFYDILEQLFSNWDFMAMQLVRVDQRRPVHVPGRRFCNLILTDSYLSLLNADVATYNENYDSSEFYFIFLQAQDQAIPEQMDLILKYCWKNHWINCNVMIQTANAEVKLYTYFPFTAQHCHQAIPMLINTYTERATWTSPIMFPKKLNNMNQCALKLVTWHVPPFVTVSESPQGEVLLNGMEIMVLKSLQTLLNFSIDVKVLKGADTRGTIYENGTLTGALGMLASRQADISLGCFIKNAKLNKVVTYSFTHCITPMVAVVMRDNYKYSSVEMLTFPFQVSVWLGLFISLALLMLFSWLLSYCSGSRCISHTSVVSSSKFHIIHTLFGMPAASNLSHSSESVYGLSWVFGAFVLRSVYQSLLFYLFHTNMYSSAPETLEDLASANYKVFGTAHIMNLAQKMPLIASGALPYFMLNSTDEMETFSYFEAHPNERFAAITARNFITHYTLDRSKQMHFHMLSRPISILQLTIYFTKHSYLIDKINEQSIVFGSSGIITGFVRRYARRLYTYESMNHENTLVSYENLKGLYLITLILLIIAFVVFLWELLAARIK